VRNALFAAIAAAAVAAVLLARSCGSEPETRPATPSPATPTPDAAPRPARSARPRSDAPADVVAKPESAPEAAAAPAGKTEVAVDEKKPKLRIRGRVLDEFGVGVGSAEIEVRAWSGTESDPQWFTVQDAAGADGSFDLTIARDRATRGFGIATTANGHVEGWRAVKLEAYDETRGVDIVVEPARAIAGRVIDGDARPIPGTTVQLWYGSETTWPTSVDGEGRFRTPPHGPRRAFELWVEAPGYPSRSVALAATTSDLTDVGDIVFRRGGRVSGVVVDARGKPVQDLWLVVSQIRDEKNPAPRCRTDTNGRFEFTDLPQDLVTIYVDVSDSEGGPAGGRRRYRGGASEIRAGATDVRLVVEGECSVKLLFIDADTRKPVDVQRAEYGLRYEGDPEPERLGQGGSSSPMLSTFLSVQSGRRYDLTVRSSGFEDAHVNGIDVGDAGELQLDVPMRRAR
jgi:hypothetical protein